MGASATRFVLPAACSMQRTSKQRLSLASYLKAERGGGGVTEFSSKVAWLWGCTAGHDGCTEGENKAGKSGLCLVTADVHAMNEHRAATRSNANKQQSSRSQQFKQASNRSARRSFSISRRAAGESRLMRRAQPIAHHVGVVASSSFL